MTKEIYTIERTAKTWKALQALGCLVRLTGGTLVLLGVTVLRKGADEPSTRIVLSNLAIAGIVLFVVGMSIHVLARLGRWWFHG